MTFEPAPKTLPRRNENEMEACHQSPLLGNA